ncbi:hypothetical protein QTP70_031765 [Hemibagrus guttatus]|uniref:Lysosomal dipeptide transporter MFSD1 n=1 Tax=Hemibagrus guttatus TaxID=175788 RepID=A0AAE0RF70_9TELE|nr:hypothetical protein QTP70_031765 [Hemibagrus guttatus]
MSQKQDSSSKVWVVGAPAHDCYPKHTAPDPYAPSCGWWAYGKVGLRLSFGLCPTESHRQRLGHQALACVPRPQAWLQAYYRFVVLFFNCMLTFGSYFCFDIPSVLQQQFQGNLTCVNSTAGNETECVDGLGMTPQEYNLLYAIYAWANAVVLIMAGFLVDKLGNRFGVFLFSFLCVLGSSIFALGSHFKGTPYLLPLMLAGRLLFGSGNGSLTIVQNRITAFWFRGKELALAFGLTLSFSRLGSVLNFFLTPCFESQYGIQWTLWGGTLLCVLGFLSAVMVSVLDKVGMKQLGLDGAIQEESRKVRVQDVHLLSLRYWLLVFTMMFFYNSIFPFIANASKFIQDKYEGYTQKQASYIVGAVYDSLVVLSSAVGILIDYVGLRGVFAALCAVCTLPVFGLLAFTFVPPLVSTIWLGITYSFAALKKEFYQAWLAQGTLEAAEAYRQAKRAADLVVLEAKTRVWEEFGGAMEKDYQTASGKFWQTIPCLLRGKQLSANTIYSGGGELLAPTGDIVGWWKEYFEDLLNPTDTPSVQESEAEDSEIDSSITPAEVTEVGGEFLPQVEELKYFRRVWGASIPLVVSCSTLGTAMGLATSVQMIGVGLCNLIVGEIRGGEEQGGMLNKMTKRSEVQNSEVQTHLGKQ